MKRRIDKVAVLGAGTMGSRIAAHLGNAGVSCILLDMASPSAAPGDGGGGRNKIVRTGLEAAKKAKPAAFFKARFAERVGI
jgi:3-hydroxyacyl-CoA dehydrogenase